MLNKFISFIEEKGLIDRSQRILLGVSGGIDSVVMTDLFSKANYSFAIAHCNFKLRGKESDEDQVFVKELCDKYQCEFFSIEFDTSGYSKQEGISIQMAARDLRYNWFKEISLKNGFNSVAIAHNRDDIAETMLINLIRGTGLKGITGIKPVSDMVIRPLLFASRSEIEDYAIKERIAYREDSSNSQTKYHRNLIRHKILPLMKKINPSVSETLYLEAEIFSSTFDLYSKELKHIRDAITVEENNKWVLSIPKMQALRISPPVLFDLISPYGFSYTDSVNIIQGLHAEPGKRFQSSQYILLKDRHSLIIEENSKTTYENVYEITSDCAEINFPVKLSFKKLARTTDFVLPATSNRISLDADLVKFPLKLRKWSAGDYFVPLGMKGRKKLSDFFIDRKINILEKEKTWLLLSENDIIWVIGQQIDDRYKVRPNTKNLLLIDLKN